MKPGAILRHHILFSSLLAKLSSQQRGQRPYLLTAGMTTPPCSSKYTHVSHLQTSNCIICEFSQSKTQGVAIQSDDIRNAVVMNWVEYKEHKKIMEYR
jgi:hypothetical protein